MKLLVKNGCVTKEQRQKIREFCKDYFCDDLTVVITKDWTFKSVKDNKKCHIGRLRGLSYNTIGVFHGGLGCIRDIYGFREVRRPCIAVNMNQENWLKVFYHEFGHYLDWKENQFNWRELSRKRKERFARDFAVLACNKENKK